MTMRSNFRLSLPVVGARPRVAVTEGGPDAALSELKSIVNGRTDLYPGGFHKKHYRGMQLRAEKPTTVQIFDAFLDCVNRGVGRETVRRVFNVWLRRYDMAASDLAGAAVAVKSLPEELLEANVSAARFTTEVADGISREKAARLADEVIEEIREVVEAVR